MPGSYLKAPEVSGMLNDHQSPTTQREAHGDIAGSIDEPMKCVWSGYPHYDRTCRSRIPASVVAKAWQREMQLKGTVEGFFYFSWRSGVWLAYGTPDGHVRGVYCPTHCSERDARDASGSEQDSDPAAG
jgi:hypothetical protein